MELQVLVLHVVGRECTFQVASVLILSVRLFSTLKANHPPSYLLSTAFKGPLSPTRTSYLPTILGLDEVGSSKEATFLTQTASFLVVRSLSSKIFQSHHNRNWIVSLLQHT
jgi:hypothetical protein